MRVNPTDSIPAVAPEPHSTEHKVEHRTAQPTAEPETPVQPAHIEATSVVVEIQKGNEAVYRFVDASTGRLIEQIPSQQMLNFAKAIEQALPPLNKPEGQK